MDILIWQRIFETHSLVDLGVGVYHWGWLQGLFGFMALGVILCYPSLRHMITFPISLAILAFSGLEDVLYYVMDGKSVPATLPWLNSNPLIFKPVTINNLVGSVLFWVVFVIALDILGGYCIARLKVFTTEKLRTFLQKTGKNKWIPIDEAAADAKQALSEV